MTVTSNPLSLPELQSISHEPASASKHLWSLWATLAESDEELRAWAADCLEHVAELSADDEELLAGHCLDRCVAQAAWACKLIGRSGKSRYEPPLISALADHPSTAVRQQAALALQRISPLSEGAKAALKKAASSTDARLMRLATEALEASS